MLRGAPGNQAALAVADQQITVSPNGIDLIFESRALIRERVGRIEARDNLRAEEKILVQPVRHPCPCGGAAENAVLENYVLTSSQLADNG